MFRRKKRAKRELTPSFHFEDTEEIKSNSKDAAENLKLDELKLERTVDLFPAPLKEIGGNRWGYLNAQGKFILPPKYDHAGDFQKNGLAIVRVKGLSGIINYNGYYIVEPKYDTIHSFSEGRASAVDRQVFTVIDENGKELTSKPYVYIGAYRQGRALFAETDERGNYVYGFLNKRGREVLPPAYEAASDFSEGKAIVKMKSGDFALINLTGKVLQTYSYAFAGYWSEGMLAFQNKADEAFGYMNEQGKIMIEPKFTGVSPFKEGCAIIRVKERFGLIDRKGQYIFKPNYHHMLYLGEGRIAIGKAMDPGNPYNGFVYALADTAGHFFTGYIYNGITSYEEGIASAFNEHSTFFIDKNGNRISDLPIVSGSGELHFNKKLIKAEIDSRLLYYEKGGALVWKPNMEIYLNDPYIIRENKYKPNKDFLIYYPQLSGLVNQNTQVKINQTLKDLAGIKETQPHLHLESNYIGDFDILFYKRDLVVVEVRGYNAPFGEVYGLPLKKYVHINLKTGELYDLKDLFKAGSQYVKVISEMICSQILKDGHFPGNYKGIQAEQPFFISKGYLNIYFPSTEISPYSANCPIFSIPLEELIRIIDQKSAFWKSFD